MCPEKNQNITNNSNDSTLRNIRTSQNFGGYIVIFCHFMDVKWKPREMKITQPFSARARRKLLGPDVGFYPQEIMLL